MSKATFVNEAPSHKYFTQMLNIAEDDLDPFQYRLLAHYVRWSGHGGEIDESLRQTGSAIKMSINKVRAAMSELQALGYLKVDRPTVKEARNGKVIHVTVLDRWGENIQRYHDKPVSNMTQVKREAVSNMTQGGVSNMTHLKEQHTRRTKNTRSRATVSASRTHKTPKAQPAPKKHSAFKVKFPTNIRSYTAVHVEAYQKAYDADMTLLIRAWAGEMFKSLTEFTTKIAQKYIEVHQEFERLHISPTEYAAIAAYTKKTNAWKSTLSVSDMLLYPTDYKTAQPTATPESKQAAEAKRRYEYEEMFGAK